MTETPYLRRYNAPACAAGPFEGEIRIQRDRIRLLFEFFFISGFCGLLYQVVWLRLAFASFGVITPVISVVISVFMLGLALGSAAAGRLVAGLARATRLSAIHFYAASELVIGAGAFVVPRLFGVGTAMLAHAGATDSFSYLSLSAVAIALAILPFAFAMGATYPLVMAYVREESDAETHSFSRLYLANVLGASMGALLTATVFVELLGFHRTLAVAGTMNLLVAIGAALLGQRSRKRGAVQQAPAPSPARDAPGPRVAWARTILFTTGFAALAMEVVWTRNFAPALGTQVYAFASLLVAYLVATWIGSYAYRKDLASGRALSIGGLLALAVIAALLPVVLNDPRAVPDGAARAVLALASVMPFCAVLGYLTPRLIDDYARGNPSMAGGAYAINAAGCILGPLVSSYALLPAVGARISLVALCLPLLLLAVAYARELPRRARWAGAGVAGGLLAFAAAGSVSYENPCSWTARNCEVRRDYTATVVSLGSGMQRRLLVNGVGITELTPITKFMGHLPAALHSGRPASALVICFGMGTTFRSLLSWGLDTTAVELVPSVRDAFPFYFDDAAAVMRNPRGRVVIDDGRRFLERTRRKFDIVVVDPPPPVEAAASSLLYSREFNEAVKHRLNPGGVFQTWFPVGEERIARAIARSLSESFPYVRVYRSVEGWGLHFTASMQPIPELDADALLARMPAAARKDLAEWSSGDLRSEVASVLGSELPISRLVTPDAPDTITDDRPFNEYFLVRRALAASR